MLFLISVFLIPVAGMTQDFDGYDYVSPFNDGMAAVKKGEQWGFINEIGELAIDFRSDLVIGESDKGSYPVFSNDRCLISATKEGVNYFGYIDKGGQIVIEPQFLNAGPFINDLAIVIYLEEEVLGENELLGKRMLAYKSLEVVINKQGDLVYSLTLPKHVNLSEKHLEQPPAIKSKFISKYLIASLNADNKWEINKIEYQ